MMPECAPIVFYDSGVGGLPYLELARSSLPREYFAYFADRAGFPYGEKDRQEVIRLALQAADMITRRLRPKALVIACNTATELAIHEVRNAFPALAVIGTVPAVKPAAVFSEVKRIAVVATERAAQDPYLLDLAMRWAPDCEVERIGDGRLVNFVETKLIGANKSERLAAVRPAVERARDFGADVLVLGCTHFIHLAQEFAQVAGAGLKIIDSRAGVVEQLARVLRDRALMNTCEDEGSSTQDRDKDAKMYLSGNDPFGVRYEAFASRFGLIPAGSLLS